MLIWLISFLLFASTCFAQTSNPPLGIRDEGGTINRPVFIIDCVGSGISCAFSGITGTLTVSGGITQYDFDTSAEFFNILADETGTGVVMGNNAPTMTSPTVQTTLNISEGIISDSTIVEADLKIVDTASDEDILTRETTTGDFEWHTCAEITGSADLCDGGDAGTGAGLAATDIDTSQKIANIVKDETGSASLGMLVFNNAPTMTSPTVQTTLTLEQSGGTDIMTGAIGGVKVTGNTQITNLASCTSVATDSGGITRCGTRGNKEMWWAATSLLPLEPSENVPPIAKDAGTNIDQLVVDFDQTTDECRTLTFKVPADILSTGTVTFYASYYMASVTTNTVIWDFRHNSGVADGVDPDVAVTTVAAAASTVPGTAGQQDLVSWTETVANLGWAANDMVDAMFCRDASADSAAADARAKGFGITIPLQ